jgi:acetate kinase
MSQLSKRILTMNKGSATLKSALYEGAIQEKPLLSITVDQVGGSAGRLRIADSTSRNLRDTPVDAADSSATLEAIFKWLDQGGFLSGLGAVGHRLVHGGARYREPQLINPEFLSEVEKLVPLDPDHMPAAIQGIKFITKKFPELPQVACFDTAFHSSLPKVARTYALPRGLRELGVVRYGFHGLSYEYIMRELHTVGEKFVKGRVIIAHLGSGASLAAIKGGKSVDTSMGFTPLEGLVMSTRSGDVDPGALLYLLGYENISVKEMNSLLNKQSGLLGVSGTSADMRTLLNNSSQDGRAADAVELFCYRAKKYIGAYAAVLGGVDVLVFAGGIGENAPAVRQRICDGLEFLGIRLDEPRNEANADIISPSGSGVSVRVIKTNEDLMIVRHVLATLGWKRAESEL